ncbi:DNA-binding ferritin-like protein [Parabacteroides sp. PFB2-10]|uniref:DUF5856 family protein n=1 Tax=Parabacteroides sp. PFB2-10 TaxID=1742405 RepID=UPI002475D1BA|nr:DUF5856 family protein [Parabacteroides sp. PFB2-10]MDH6311727.1 DNA-binding ferritin-like protein [Parabacteroides sp. PFB2-10]
METKVKEKTVSVSQSKKELANFIGELYAFNVSLKLFHWHVTGPASYAQHMALDQAIDSLNETLDSVAETSYALVGDLDIVVPQIKTPKNIIKHVEGFYDHIQDGRKHFTEDFSAGLMDDFQEALQQLLYRLKRLQ